ncbi:MAG: hypothetical protein Q9191_004169 [Dirinaria sp. TL-2023a]
MPLRNPTWPNHQISPANEKPSSDLRSPEDNLTLWQFMTVSWMSPLIRTGYSRQLNDDDVWSLGYEFQHDLLHNQFADLGGSVTKRLLVANSQDIVINFVLAVIETVANLAGPVLLQQLLQSMEDRNASSSQATKRCYERSRGEMLTMLHAKTLSRKRFGNSAQSAITSDDEDSNNFHPSKTESSGPLRALLARIEQLVRNKRKQEHKPTAPTSTGKLFNMMRNDVYEISQRFWEIQTLVTTPLNLILSIILVWKLIGWPCLVGVSTILIAQGINALLTRALLKWERIRRSATDGKLQKITQFIEAIRHLRWYGWQKFWQRSIIEARQRELYLRVVTSLWRILISFTNNLSSGMFPVVAFWAYVTLAGKPLRVDVAFPALQLFTMLESSLRIVPLLITIFLNAKIAMDRIEGFMREPDKEESNDFNPDTRIFKSTRSLAGEVDLATPDQYPLVLDKASFNWPGTSKSVLNDISLQCPMGITLVCGKVGVGKSSLLQGLLGEMDMHRGSISRSHAAIGYCSQTPWLQSMSIKENITFFSPHDDDRYSHVLKACALNKDLSAFKYGDLSNIGENGIGLSGGQKMRVALARALYSQAKILLLDDPLSALDQQTAESVVQECFTGSLMKDRAVVLVTHRPDLCQGIAKQTIEILDDGTARVHDQATGAFGSLSNVECTVSTEDGERDNKNQEANDPPQKFIEDEHRAHGGVRFGVYWAYM